MTRAPRKPGRLTLDQAMIAVLVAAMEANQHVSAEEAARAHHIIWSMRRFRSRSGETVDRLIETVRNRAGEEGATALLQEAARTIPARLRPSAFAVAVDLVLADTKLERAERQFVARLATALKMRRALADDILAVMRIKNGA
jgi:uncharacterized tellurite resistance protein B-like protein